jgi:ribosome-associated translation inhibitor RaiA
MMDSAYSAFFFIRPHLQSSSTATTEEAEMHIDIQARGFTLSEALLLAVEERAEGFRLAFPDIRPQIQVRLFDVNGDRGGVDKGCLLHVRLGLRARSVVVTDVDDDLYRAIAGAFVKLDRAVRHHLRRRYRHRRDSLRLIMETH